jgi:hypothetical protein
MSMSTLTRCSSTPSADTLVKAAGSTRRTRPCSTTGPPQRSMRTALPGGACSASVVSSSATTSSRDTSPISISGVPSATVASLVTCTFSTRPGHRRAQLEGGRRRGRRAHHAQRHARLLQVVARHVLAFDRRFQFLLRRLHRQAVAVSLVGATKPCCASCSLRLQVVARALQRHACGLHALAACSTRPAAPSTRAAVRAGCVRPAAASAPAAARQHVAGLDLVAFAQRDARSRPASGADTHVAVGQPGARVLVDRGLEGPGWPGQFHRPAAAARRPRPAGQRQAPRRRRRVIQVVRFMSPGPHSLVFSAATMSSGRCAGAPPARWPAPATTTHSAAQA